MAASPIIVHPFQFPGNVKPPASDNLLFLAGAGERGLEIEGKFIRFTAIGVYLEEKAPQILSSKWKGKSSDELNDSVDFVRDIITGPFEKFAKITMILPLTGKQYSEKVAENCIAAWKSLGIYTEAAQNAVDKFLLIFENENFLPGFSILFTVLADGSLVITFSKDDSMDDVPATVIDSRLLSEAILESIIGKNGVSPAARLSVCTRMSELMKNCHYDMDARTLSKISEIKVEQFTFPPSAKPPAASNTLLLIGAGVRGLEIEGKFIKFTSIGVYLEKKAVTSLASNWKGKTISELNDSSEFFRSIVTGPFEKFTRVTMILPLSGQQYSEKVAENCVAIWKSLGLYSDAAANAVEKFLAEFKTKNFSPGSSILFTHLPRGALSISFANHEEMAEDEACLIENKLLSESILESIIGKQGVSPQTRLSMSERLCELF